MNKIQLSVEQNIMAWESLLDKFGACEEQISVRYQRQPIYQRIQ